MCWGAVQLTCSHTSHEKQQSMGVCCPPLAPLMQRWYGLGAYEAESAQGSALHYSKAHMSVGPIPIPQPRMATHPDALDRFASPQQGHHLLRKVLAMAGVPSVLAADADPCGHACQGGLLTEQLCDGLDLQQAGHGLEAQQVDLQAGRQANSGRSSFQMWASVCALG